jgi:hypothetical protein
LPASSLPNTTLVGSCQNSAAPADLGHLLEGCVDDSLSPEDHARGCISSNVRVVQQRIAPSGRPRTADTYERWCRSTDSSNNSGRT